MDGINPFYEKAPDTVEELEFQRTESIYQRWVRQAENSGSDDPEGDVLRWMESIDIVALWREIGSP